MDLHSTYAGVSLPSPIVLGASPLSSHPERLFELIDHGIGAVVLPSIFEEQISATAKGLTLTVPDGIAKNLVLTTYSDLDRYNGGAEEYLNRIERLKKSIPVPVIANINCHTTGPWMRYAKPIQSAGADAIELNLYHYDLDPHRFSDEIEKCLIDRVAEFRRHCDLPFSVKLTPSFTNLANIIYRLGGTGVDSVCLFGKSPVRRSRLGENETDASHYQWRLSRSGELETTLEGLFQVRGVVKSLTVAACGGIGEAEDAVAAIRSGADAVMITSAIYRNGPQIVSAIEKAIRAEVTRLKLESFRDLVKVQGHGFDPFRESNHRTEYFSAMTKSDPDDKSHEHPTGD